MTPCDPVHVAPEVNIFSGTPGLGAALTNPTEIGFRKGSLQHHYPVTFRGTGWPDAERAFQCYARGLSFEDQQTLCVAIVEAKLEQHPRLVEAIDERGGAAWLKRCWHSTGARSESFRRWEGRGAASPFLRSLMLAYSFRVLLTADPDLLAYLLKTNPKMCVALRRLLDTSPTAEAT